MHIYLLSKLVGCYKMKKQLLKRFHYIDLKTDKEYKKWKEIEDSNLHNHWNIVKNN